MSHTFFETQFQKFKDQFKPAQNFIDGVTLKMTMGEMLDVFTQLDPSINNDDLYSLLTEAGYVYEPVEFNGHIDFYWLLLKSG